MSQDLFDLTEMMRPRPVDVIDLSSEAANFIVSLTDSVNGRNDVRLSVPTLADALRERKRLSRLVYLESNSDALCQDEPLVFNDAAIEREIASMGKSVEIESLSSIPRGFEPPHACGCETHWVVISDAITGEFVRTIGAVIITQNPERICDNFTNLLARAWGWHEGDGDCGKWLVQMRGAKVEYIINTPEY